MLSSRQAEDRRAVHDAVTGALAVAAQVVPSVRRLAVTIGDEFQGRYAMLGEALDPVNAALLFRDHLVGYLWPDRFDSWRLASTRHNPDELAEREGMSASTGAQRVRADGIGTVLAAHEAGAFRSGPVAFHSLVEKLGLHTSSTPPRTCCWRKLATGNVIVRLVLVSVGALRPVLTAAGLVIAAKGLIRFPSCRASAATVSRSTARASTR